MTTFTFIQPDEPFRGSNTATVDKINNYEDEDDDESDEFDDYSTSLLYFEGSLYTKYISPTLGTGLFIDEVIPAGSAIVAERVLWISEAEQDTCTTTTDVTLLLTRKLQAMGKKWTARFVALAADSNRSDNNSGNALGEIWDAHNIPTVWGSKRGAILGLNMAWINHSCTPNCTLTITHRSPSGQDGRRKPHARPRMGRAILRAAKDIPRGAELTIGYFHPAGCVAFRGINCYLQFGFHCVCRCCTQLHSELEETLEGTHRLGLLLQTPELVTTWPAGFFQVAHDLEHCIASVTPYDIRLALTWAKCALVAGYHSDLARAICFLRKARRLAMLIEGPMGKFYDQLMRWSQSPELMPGFGATTRGLSSYAESDVVTENGLEDEHVLFMTDAKSRSEYIRVSQYERIRRKDKGEDKEEEGGDGDRTKRHARPKWRILPGVDEGKTGKKDRSRQPLDMAARARRKLFRERCNEENMQMEFLDSYLLTVIGVLKDSPDFKRSLGLKKGRGEA